MQVVVVASVVAGALVVASAPPAASAPPGDSRPKKKTAASIAAKKQSESATKPPTWRPGKSGRRRGITIETTSANETTARPTRPSPSLCPFESAKTITAPDATTRGRRR